MKLIRSLAFAAAVLVVAGGATSARHDQHQAHHPAQAVSPTQPAMQTQMKAMQAMHEKMMAAKTPEERSALMAEHMKTMQEGMSMMQGMKGSAAKMGTADRQRMIEMRMDMMQSMMEMMMDRMPAGPAK